MMTFSAKGVIPTVEAGCRCSYLEIVAVQRILSAYSFDGDRPASYGGARHEPGATALGIETQPERCSAVVAISVSAPLGCTTFQGLLGHAEIDALAEGPYGVKN